MCAWVCLPAAIMFASASAQPYRADCTAGGRPLATNCWPSSLSPRFPDSPLVFGGTSCSCWHSWRFHRVLLLLPLIYLWHTHPVTPLTLTHTRSRLYTFLCQGKQHFPPFTASWWIRGERTVNERGFYDFLSWRLCCLWLGGQLFIYIYNNCIIFEIIPSISTTCTFLSVCLCVRLPWSAFMFRLPLARVVRF